MERTLNFNINSDKIKKGLNVVNSGLKKTQKIGMSAAKMVGNAFKKMAGSLFSLKGAFAGLLGAAGFGALIKMSLNAIDKIGKFATQTGLATETLGMLQLGADLAGTSLDATVTAAVKLGKGINDFVVLGAGRAGKAFVQMGISAEQLKPIMNDTEAQLGLIADKFAAMEDGGNKSALAMRLFGEAGVALVPLLNEGSAGFAKLREEAERYGLIMSEATVRGVEAVNDSMTRLKSRMTGIVNQTVAALAPAMTKAFDSIGNAVDTYIKKQGGIAVVANKMANTVINAVEKIVLAIISMTNALIDFKNKWDQFSIGGAIADANAAAGQSIIDSAKSGLKSVWDWATGVDEVTTKVGALQAKIAEPMDLISKDAATSFFTNIRAGLSNAVNDVSVGGGGGDSMGGTGSTGLANMPAANDNAQLEQGIEALTQSLMTEEERIAESYSRRQFMVEEAFQNELISDMTRKDMSLQLEQQFEDQKTAIAERASRDRQMLNAATVSNTASMLGSISQLMSTQGKKQSRMAKVLAKASIIANTAAGIMKSHAQVPWPGNWAEAGAIALAGAASLRQLNVGGSVASAGGGQVSSGSVATPPPVATPTQTTPTRGETTIQLQGNFYGWDDQVIDELITGISSAIDDRDVRIISPDSRQAQDLREVA